MPNDYTDQGIGLQAFLNLCDDTRHLCGVVSAPGERAQFVNVDTAPASINNDAELAWLLDGLSDLSTPEHDEPVAVGAPAPVADPVLKPVSECLPDIAPSFRLYGALPAPNCGKTYSEADREQLIKKQVDDILWLHRSGHRVAIDSPKYRLMLKGTTIDIELVREFAREEWSSEHKTKLLRVGLALQFELSIFKTKSVKDKHRNALASVADTRQKLDSMAETDSRYDADVWCDVLLCAKLMGADKPSTVARIYKAMTGRTMTRQNIARTLDRIKKRLARVADEESVPVSTFSACRT